MHSLYSNPHYSVPIVIQDMTTICGMLLHLYGLFCFTLLSCGHHRTSCFRKASFTLFRKVLLVVFSSYLLSAFWQALYTDFYKPKKMKSAKTDSNHGLFFLPQSRNCRLYPWHTLIYGYKRKVFIQVCWSSFLLPETL